MGDHNKELIESEFVTIKNRYDRTLSAIEYAAKLMKTAIGEMDKCFSNNGDVKKSLDSWQNDLSSLQARMKEANASMSSLAENYMTDFKASSEKAENVKKYASAKFDNKGKVSEDTNNFKKSKYSF